MAANRRSTFDSSGWRHAPCADTQTIARRAAARSGARRARARRGRGSSRTTGRSSWRRTSRGDFRLVSEVPRSPAARIDVPYSQRSIPCRDAPPRAAARARQLSQEQLAEELGATEPEISKIERRTEMYVSTLRRFVEAMGSDGTVRITQFQELDTSSQRFAGSAGARARRVCTRAWESRDSRPRPSVGSPPASPFFGKALRARPLFRFRVPLDRRAKPEAPTR
jgi:transcriptional regulator with XRE-family HTH domain